MEPIVVYSAKNSSRLVYVLDWLLKERLRLDYRITNNPSDAASLSYGAPSSNGVSVFAEELLWEKAIHKISPKTGTWNDLPVLFPAPNKNYTVPFDLFSAAFYLLSRYEEYDNYNHDKHGRYMPTNSVLYKNGWLMRPILDEWVTAFRNQLQTTLGITIPATPFVLQPTYDIDMAYSHIYKGAGRIIGAYMRAFLKGDLRQIAERTQVLKKKQKDPYDSFRWLRQLHKQYDYKPVYFVLAANKTTAFDKNIHPKHPAMMRVIKNLAKEGAIGIHPSYYSEHNDALAREKSMLELVAGRVTTISRQHYIKLKMPDTYRLLASNHITADYSMGYGSHLGFRAGTGNSFLWYDLEKEAVAQIRIYPFCFMDTTAHYDAKLSPADAFEKLEAMSKILERTGSTMITVFHNFSLGTSNEWKGWRQNYENFLQEKTMQHKDAVPFH